MDRILGVRCLLVLSGVLLSLVGCSSDEDSSPTSSGPPSLTIIASPTSVVADGTPSKLVVRARSEPLRPGAGSVELVASGGKLGGEGSIKSVVLVDGAATVDFSCSEPACVGSQKVTGSWNGLNAEASVVFTSTEVPDAGPDVVDDVAEADVSEDTSIDVPLDQTDEPAEVDAPQDVMPDTDLDGGMDADVGPLPNLEAQSVPQAIYIDIDMHSVIQAVLTESGDGGVMAGEQIRFTTDLGAVGIPEDPSTYGEEQTVETDSEGKAEVWFEADGVVGNAAVTAVHLDTGATTTVVVPVVSLQQITHTNTLCAGKDCTIMGIKGSGFNEQAHVTFTLMDADGLGASGVPVTFAIDNPPSETTFTTDGITDAEGKVTTIITAGPVIGAFTVRAIVIPGELEAESPTVGIRGATPANNGFSLQCSPSNVGVYVSPTPPKEFDINCNVKVVDRYNNPVGTGTTVNFKVEAGAIPNSVNTKKYDPKTTNTDEGTATLVFSTIGEFPPWNVDPLPQIGQWPLPRQEEPANPVGGIVHNPRDGFVSILGYVRGEEFFSDDNSNGDWDEGEQFVDQGEPFVDANDNGVRDTGEVYIDEAPADGVWNPPNGLWDNDTSIWVETRVLYSGVPDGYLSHAEPANFGSLAPQAIVTIDAYFPDINFNRPQAQNTTFTMTHTANRGSVSWKSGGLLDGFGFGWERRLVDAETEEECENTSPICVWKGLFIGWEEGYCGNGEVEGASTSLPDGGTGTPDSVQIRSTVLQNLVTIESVGYIE